VKELLAKYPEAQGRFDELFEAPAKPRAHWMRAMMELAATSPVDMRQRLSAAERQIRDSGITYNVYADPQGLDRPWHLDVLPLIIAPDEWREIEAGITQRAQLFNQVLSDIYGSQSLLKHGLLPPSLIFGQSGFLRPACGMNLPGGVHLHVYAADLARSPDGRWWVMADRTQAPSGAGYALENRLIVSRAFPALYRDLHVQHVARFFATLRDSLMHFAPKGDGPTLTVLLTPGPYNETYFEHALLARYLGFPLVEGSDLIVRNGRIWLKTIGGLKRVHAILRRQDDNFCDPLELRSDSALGIPGRHLSQRLDREARGDFPRGVAPHPVGDREETQVRIQPELVLVPFPAASDVAQPVGRGLHRAAPRGETRRGSVARPVRSSSSLTDAAVTVGSCSRTSSSWVSVSLNCPALRCANARLILAIR